MRALGRLLCLVIRAGLRPASGLSARRGLAGGGFSFGPLAGSLGGLAKQRLHGKGYARQVFVDLDDLCLDNLSHAYDVARVAHVPVCELGEVDQAVLVYADIDEGAEVGYVCDHALDFHAHFEVFDGVDAFEELGRLKLASRVLAGSEEFCPDVFQSECPDGVVFEL